MVYKSNRYYQTSTRDTQQRFRREQIVLVLCQYCRKPYRARAGSVRVVMRACYSHVDLWYHDNYEKYKEQYNTPIYKMLRYTHWKVWVIRNMQRRQQQALESYHRNKNKPENKKRRHRRTKG